MHCCCSYGGFREVMSLLRGDTFLSGYFRLAQCTMPISGDLCTVKPAYNALGYIKSFRLERSYMVDCRMCTHEHSIPRHLLGFLDCKTLTDGFVFRDTLESPQPACCSNLILCELHTPTPHLLYCPLPSFPWGNFTPSGHGKFRLSLGWSAEKLQVFTFCVYDA